MNSNSRLLAIAAATLFAQIALSAEQSKPTEMGKCFGTPSQNHCKGNTACRTANSIDDDPGNWKKVRRGECKDKVQAPPPAPKGNNKDKD